MEWENIIQIRKDWVDSELTHHLTEEVNSKLSFRVYTILPSSIDFNFISLSKFLTKILPHYVKSKNEINIELQRKIKKKVKEIKKKNSHLSLNELDTLIKTESERTTQETWFEIFNESRKFFKKKSEKYIGGKYGELLLFALVEGVLKCKMIAHKISHLSNVNDEVKGSDGIFIGEYKNKEALLIGESKVMQNFSDAIKEALESINRYHSDKEQAHNLSHELLIARGDIHKYDDGVIDIDELYERLNVEEDAYRRQILVHPILLMYEREFIQKLKIKSTSQEEFVDKLNKMMLKKIKEKKRGVELIKNKVNESQLEHVFLDFFLIPVDKVERFRSSLDDNLL